jgi:hypothetical protein
MTDIRNGDGVYLGPQTPEPTYEATYWPRR